MSDDKTYNVLFICTQYSARSIMAERFLNHLGGKRFRGFSAGSHPAGQVQALALQTLRHYLVPTEGFHSKDWAEFARPGAPEMDFMFTVCDKAAGEVCPVWPGQPMTARWGVADPSAVQGSEAERFRAFTDAATVLERRIELMMALPLASLDRLAIQREVRDIGKR